MIMINNRRTQTVRKTTLSRHHGATIKNNYYYVAQNFVIIITKCATIHGPPETPRTPQHYRMEGFKGGLNWSPIMPRDASLSIWERTNAF